MNKTVTQEESMGCGIACVAAILDRSYKSAKKLFENPQYSASRGYYCRDLVKVLNKSGLDYTFAKINKKNKYLVEREETIVFVKKSKNYPFGHYLFKTKRGWMNSWINFPSINPAKSGFQKKLPAKAEWVIFVKKFEQKHI